MAMFVSTALLTMLMLIHFAVHSGRGWGFQEGDRSAMLLVLIQMLIALAAWVWSLINLTNKSDLLRRRAFLLASMHAASVIAMFLLFGWQIFTSAHRQGSENLVFFLFAALLPVWLSIYRKRTP